MSDISLSKAVRTNLLSLQGTAEMMAKTQERLATGNKVNSALDNPTNFFTASSLNSRAGDLNSLMDSMSNGIKTLEAADNGLTAITKTLESMQSTLRQARQDKSFQNGIYEVTKDSVITVNGGQFTLPTDVKLGTETPGIKSELKTVATTPYYGPTVSTNASVDGMGARTLISNSGAGLVAGAVIKVAGMDVTLADTTVDGVLTPQEIATQVDAVINGVGSPERNKYTVSLGAAGSPNEGMVILETVKPSDPAPAVSFTSGATPAVKASTTFNYSAITTSVSVGGEAVPTGSTYEQFVANLTSSEVAGNFKVTHDPVTKNITLTALEHGDTAPPVTGVKANQVLTAASSTVDLTNANANTGGTYTIDGVGLTLATGLTTPAAVFADLNTKLLANPTLSARYTATFDNTTNVMTLTDNTPGANRTQAVVSSTGFATAPSNTVVFAPGLDAVTGGAVSAPATAGIWQKTVEAHPDTFKVTYDGKSTDIKITGIKGGVGSTTPNAIEIKDWQDATIAKVNADLKMAGITGVEAAFDTDGKFSIVGKTPEAKSVIISGDDGIRLFGNNAVSTGTETIDGYSSTTPVDKFVEEINRTHAGKLRASNDNGKLRIENLSTVELAVQFDADGAGPGGQVASKIAGNSVRENLSLQFNDLKNQLDRLSDDASFNGINLLRGDNLKITFNESGNSFIDVQTADGKGLNSSALNVRNLQGLDLDTDDGIDKLLGDIKLALSDVRSQASVFGSNLSIVQNRQDFTKQMINTLQTGAANLTLADMNEEAANLLALQTRQSLSSSSLSLASQADQSVLQLLQ